MRPLPRILLTLVILGAVVGCGDDAVNGVPYDPANSSGGARPTPTFDTSMQLEDIYASFPAVEDAVRSGAAFDQPSTNNGGNYLDCEDFNSRAEAQAYLDSNPRDLHYLDGDGDGIACEWGTN